VQGREVWLHSSRNNSLLGELFNLTDAGITKYTWEEDAGYVEGVVRFYDRIGYRTFPYQKALYDSDDLAEYLQAAFKDDYLVIMAVKDEASRNIPDSVISFMKSAGATFNIKDSYRYSYAAIIDNGAIVYEAMSPESISHSAAICNLDIDIFSAGFDCGNKASILIDTKEYAVNQRGLNIVVYDKSMCKIVDSVRFDTFIPENTVSRSY
jgi:hypothetical protein